MGNRWGKSGNSVRIYFGGSKITEDGDWSHEIKRSLLLGRKVMSNLDSIFQSRDWNSTILVTSCEELTHWKRLWSGRDWGQEETGMTEVEMAGWHHGLDGRESEWTPGVGDGQGGLACYDSWGRKELNMIEWLNWTELTRRTFVSKVMSLLFNMLSRLVINFLPRSKCLLISWLQSPSAVILEPPK